MDDEQKPRGMRVGYAITALGVACWAAHAVWRAKSGDAPVALLVGGIALVVAGYVVRRYSS